MTHFMVHHTLAQWGFPALGSMAVATSQVHLLSLEKTHKADIAIDQARPLDCQSDPIQKKSKSNPGNPKAIQIQGCCRLENQRNPEIQTKSKAGLLLNNPNPMSARSEPIQIQGETLA